MMKFKNIIINFVLFSGTFLLANGDVNIELFKNIKMLNNTTMRVVKARELDGIYHLKFLVESGIEYKEMEGFVTKDLKTVILGKAYRVKDGAKISLPIDMSKYKKTIDMSQYKDRAAFSIGEGSKEYYVFIDPMCSHCKEFEKVSKFIAKKAKIYYFFFPLGISKNSFPIASYVMSKPLDERSETLYNIQLKGDENYLKDFDRKNSLELLNKQIEVAKELGIRSTPTFLNKDAQRKDWSVIAGSYGAQMPLNKDGLSYLIKKNYALNIRGGEKELFVFIDINSPESNMILSKLSNKYTLNIFLLADENNKNSRLKTAYIYSKKDTDTRLNTFKKHINKMKIGKEERELMMRELSKKNDYSLIMSISLISKKSGVVKTPTIADSDGNILKIEEL